MKRLLFKHFQLLFDAWQHYFYYISLSIKVFLVLHTGVDSTASDLIDFSLSRQFEKKKKPSEFQFFFLGLCL